MYSVDLLVGRPAFALCATGFRDGASGLPPNSSVVRNGFARVRDAVSQLSAKGPQCQDNEASQTFLRLATLGHLGNERATSERANRRTYHFRALGAHGLVKTSHDNLVSIIIFPFELIATDKVVFRIFRVRFACIFLLCKNIMLLIFLELFCEGFVDVDFCNLVHV